MWLLVKPEVKRHPLRLNVYLKIALTCDHKPYVYQLEQIIPDLCTLKYIDEQ